MKHRSGRVFIAVAIVIVVFVLALLINHLVCQGENAPEFLLKIDTAFTNAAKALIDGIADFFDYTKYLFKKITAKKTPEYPTEQLPLYPDCKISRYSFDEKTNTVLISLNTSDDLASVAEYYDVLFTGKTTVDYFKQYNLADEYTAFGMIGNFNFLLDTQPNDSKKYNTTVNICLHYLLGDELARENFFRTNGGMDSYLYTHPYIYMYQGMGDNESIYLQLRDYKSQLLNISTNIELYIDGEFHSSRFYGDTLRVPISAIDGMHTIKMISYDENQNVIAMDILQNFVCYNAADEQSLYNMTEKHSSAEHIFMYNTESLNDITFFFYFPNLKSLYFEGNNNLTDYSALLLLENISLLNISKVNDETITKLFNLQNLKMLQIENSSYDISLGENFISLQSPELIIKNCPNISFSEYGLFSFRLERLEIDNNYSLENLSFISPYPNFRMLSLSRVDSLSTLFNTLNLEKLNVFKADSCQKLDLSQPLNSTSTLMNVNITSCPSMGKSGNAYIDSIWQSENLIQYSAENCSYINDISYASTPWNEVE